MNKKLMKVITLILTCLLLVGAAVGITVAAEDAEAATPSVEIAKKNVSYDSKAQILYAVNAENVPEGATVQMLFGTAAQTAVVGEVAVGAKDANGTYNGMPVFFSAGIAAKDYRMDIYAAPVIVDADGKIIAKGEAVNFTPYDYAMTRFNGNYSKEQLNLYKAFLDYGAAVQAALGYTEANIETLGGWIDTYYNVTVNGVTSTLRPSEIPEGKIAVEALQRFDAEGNIFYGWVDENDELVAGWLDYLAPLPGDVKATPKYVAPNASLVAFNSDITGASTTATAYPEAGLTEDNSGVYYKVENGAIRLEQKNNKGAAASVRVAPANADAYAQKYIFETDFNLVEWNMPGTNWIHKFCLWGEANTWEIFNATLNRAGEDTYTIGGVTLKLNTWNNLKMVAEVLEDGTVHTYTYVNGSYAGGGHSDSLNKFGNYRMASAGIGMRNNANANVCDDSVLLLDNMMCYTEGEAVSYELGFDVNGGNEVEPCVVTMGQAYILPTPVNGELPFLGWYIGGTKIAQSGTWTYYGAIPTLTAKWATPMEITLNITEGVTETVNVTFGMPYELPTQTLEGFGFAGYVDADGNAVPLTGDAWPYEEVVVLTAKWEAPIDVTINIDSATVQNATVYAGLPYVLPTPTAEGLIFAGYADAEGNTIPSVGDAWTYGKNVVLTAKWNVEVAGKTYTFDTATEGGFGKGTADGKVEGGKFVLNNTGWNSQVYFAINSNSTPYNNMSAGAVYVFEMDFTYVGGAIASSSGSEPAYIGFQNASNFGSYNGSQYSNGELLKPTTAASAEGDAAGVIMYGVTFNKGETYKIRFEHVVGNDAYINVYVNDAFVRTHKYNSINTAADPTQVVGFQFTFRRVGNFVFDNVYCGIQAPAKETHFTLDAGIGTLPESAASEYTLMTGQSYTLPTPVVASGLKFVGWYYGDNFIASSGNWASDLGENAVLVAKYAFLDAHSADFSESKPSWVAGGGLSVSDGALQSVYNSGGIHFLPTSTVTGAMVGTKYVVEFDMIYNGATSKMSSAAFMGFSHTNTGWQGGTHLWSYVDLTTTTASFYGNSFAKGTSYNVRFEFTVTGASTGVLAVYVDGNLGKNSATVINGLKTGDFYQFNIQWRGDAANCGLSFTFDNVYVAVETPAVATNVTLDTQGGTLPEGAINGFDIISGMQVPALPTPVNGDKIFLGWYADGTLVESGTIWTGTADTALVAKWGVVEKTENDRALSLSDYKAEQFAYTQTATAGAAGAVYQFSSKFTFKGLSSFDVAEDGTVTARNAGINFAYPRIYGYKADGTISQIGGDTSLTVVSNSAFVNAEGVNVVGADGKLLAEFADLTGDQIFYSQITLFGYTFDINEAYDFVITVAVNADGTASRTILEITNEDGECTEIVISESAAVVAFQRFQFEIRGKTSSKASDFTLNCLFSEIKYIVCNPAV